MPKQMKVPKMNRLHIGQPVVCVNDHWPDGSDYQEEDLPRVGEVYTVRAIVPTEHLGFDEDGVLLEEIVNRPRIYDTPVGELRGELVFRASRFRLLHRADVNTAQERTRVLEPA